MFFVLSKLLGFVTTPSNLVAILCVVGLAFAYIKPRAGLWVLTAGVALLLIAGYSPLGNVLLLSLSERFSPWQANGRVPDGIIVLGGAIDSDVSVARNSIEVDASAERILTMLELARVYPQAKIVFTGGSGDLLGASVPEAPIAGALLERFGVARDRIVLESASRTTDENAVFVRKMVAPKPGELWLLVTSAFHMPRSLGAFRAAGFAVEPYPVDWRTRGWRDATIPIERLSAGLARCDVAMHEWTGLVAYWLTGRSKTLLPAP